MNAELHEIMERLSDAEKRTLRDMLDRELTRPAEANGGQNRPREFGWARGQVSMSPDFDEPLEDFRDYME